MVCTYMINGVKIIDNEPHLIVLTSYGKVYKYNTINGLYHYTFPGLLLGKYRTVFYDEIGNNDILKCFIFSTIPIDEEEEETNEEGLKEGLINDIINDVIKEDKEDLIKLDNELKHLSSNVLV